MPAASSVAAVAASIGPAAAPRQPLRAQQARRRAGVPGDRRRAGSGGGGRTAVHGVWARPATRHGIRALDRRPVPRATGAVARASRRRARLHLHRRRRGRPHRSPPQGTPGPGLQRVGPGSRPVGRRARTDRARGRAERDAGAAAGLERRSADHGRLWAKVGRRAGLRAANHAVGGGRAPGGRCPRG